MSGQAATQTQTVAKPAITPQRAGLLQRQCACGQHTPGSGECEECKKKHTDILQRVAIDSASVNEVPPIVHEVLRSPGQPLDAGTRAFMEPRFGQDFSKTPTSGRQPTLPARLSIGAPHDIFEHEADATAARVTTMSAAPADKRHNFRGVRIHTDARASESAKFVNALAYTVGQDIIFGQNQYMPGTAAGKHLLAHELTHVIQQSRSGLTLQRDTPANTDQTAAQPVNRYKVKIPADINSLPQFNRYVETVIFGRVINTNWKPSDKLLRIFENGSGLAGTEVNIEVSTSLVQAVGAPSSAEKLTEKATATADYATLQGGQREQVNTEIDRRYFESLDAKPGTKIQKGETGKIAIWNSFRQQVLADKRKLEALPQGIQDILGPSESFKPEDYDKLNRIADKLTSMSAADLEDYKSKINSSTTDLSMLEDSINRYLAERAKRQKELEKREALVTKLYGLKSVFHLYKAYKSSESKSHAPTIGNRDIANEAKDYYSDLAASQKLELLAALQVRGFGSIAEFEEAISAYEQSFHKETVAIALDMLAKYEHVLYEAKEKYSDRANAAAVYQSLGKTQAKARYNEAIGAESLSDSIRPGPDTPRYQPGEFQLKQKYAREGAAARDQAESEIAPVAQAHPLIASPDFNRQALALASDEADVQSKLLDYIGEHQQAIRDMREDLNDDDEFVYKLDKVLEASFKQQNIDPASIFYEIIQDKIGDISTGKIIKAIFLAILGIAFTILTLGTGALAVGGAIGLFGISAYQAYESFKDYETESGAKKTDLLSKEPTLFWVIVAVVGAGIDLAAVGSAIKAIRPAVEAFNATSDVAQLEKSLAKLRELGEINTSIEQNVAKAARAEVQYRSAVGEIFASGGRLRMVVVPFAEEFGRFVVASYYLAKRGVISFERFLLELKAQKLIGEIKELSPEHLTILKKAFEEGLEKSKTGLIETEKLSENVRSAYNAEQLEEVAARGKALGMKDEEVAVALEKGAESHKGAKQLEEELSAAVETQRLTNRYEQMTDQQIRDILKTDRDAPYELIRRYRLKSANELKQLANADDETARLILRERKNALQEARVGTRNLPGEQPVWNRLEDHLLANRSVNPKTPETGTMGVAETDLALKERSFEGGSIRTGETPDPTYPPPTDFPSAQGHAEQNILGKLKAAIVEAGLDKTPGALQGKKVWILVDQEVCTTCRTGLMDDILKEGKPSGVLKQFSKDFPELTIEVTDWGTGKIWRLLGGRLIR